MDQVEKADYIKNVITDKVGEILLLGYSLNLSKKQTLLMFQDTIDSFGKSEF
jgi:hypothetical protein